MFAVKLQSESKPKIAKGTESCFGLVWFGSFCCNIASCKQLHTAIVARVKSGRLVTVLLTGAIPCAVIMC